MSIVCVGAAPAPAFASPPAAVKIDNPRALGILHIGRMEDGGMGLEMGWDVIGETTHFHQAVCVFFFVLGN